MLLGLSVQEFCEKTPTCGSDSSTNKIGTKIRLFFTKTDWSQKMFVTKKNVTKEKFGTRQISSLNCHTKPVTKFYFVRNNCEKYCCDKQIIKNIMNTKLYNKKNCDPKQV